MSPWRRGGNREKRGQWCGAEAVGRPGKQHWPGLPPAAATEEAARPACPLAMPVSETGRKGFPPQTSVGSEWLTPGVAWRGRPPPRGGGPLLQVTSRHAPASIPHKGGEGRKLCSTKCTFHQVCGGGGTAAVLGWRSWVLRWRGAPSPPPPGCLPLHQPAGHLKADVGRGFPATCCTSPLQIP